MQKCAQYGYLQTNKAPLTYKCSDILLKRKYFHEMDTFITCLITFHYWSQTIVLWLHLDVEILYRILD